MRINCEIPDHIGRIFKEFLQISDQSDDDIAGYIILYLQESALQALEAHRQREIGREIDQGRDYYAKLTEEKQEIDNKIADLTYFGSEWIKRWSERAVEAVKQKKQEKFKEVKRRWQDATKDGGSCAATRRKA